MIACESSTHSDSGTDSMKWTNPNSCSECGDGCCNNFQFSPADMEEFVRDNNPKQPIEIDDVLENPPPQEGSGLQEADDLEAPCPISGVGDIDHVLSHKGPRDLETVTSPFLRRSGSSYGQLFRPGLVPVRP